MIIVSACLMGINCKYNGNNNFNKEIEKYLEDKQFILVCPEQLGGLSTPRNPSEITHNKKAKRVTSNLGKDVTDNFIKGANEVLKIAQIYNCREAILKEGSPSCGSNYVYDGSFTGKKVSGIGVTTQVLRDNRVKVISENEI